ncbi:MAG TPA: hypothetical protein VLW53_11195, partial [Candidatus Eisenbacteria bacterium]|nr:hypothetical protein [Candidatus Eisenbacteria bacterium]
MSPTRRTPPAPPGDDARVLDETAALLYRTPPREFVAARDARVRELKAQDRRTLAADVERLRRPTVAAWLVNLLVADDPELPDQMAELAGQLRDAQQQLAGDALRALGQQRQRLVAGLVARARSLAGGSRPPESALTEVESSLRAALADPDVARDVLSGRLLRAADVSGFGPEPTARPPSAPAAPERTRRTARARATRGARQPREEERERQEAEARRAAERRAAERRLELRRRLRAAEQELKQAEKDRAA